MAGQRDQHLFWGPTHINSNLLCAMDFRHDGSNLLEVCCVPMNHSYQRHPSLPPLHMKIRPSFPVNHKVARVSIPTLKKEYMTSLMDSSDAREQFERWHGEVLKMKERKKIMPLVYGWGTKARILQEWLGESFEVLIHEQARDMQTLQAWFQDRYDFWGDTSEIIATTEAEVSRFLNIERDKNSIPGNCVALIKAYEKTLRLFLPGFKQ